ncbi:hypothetical protein MCP1_80027 [Candidatus Terasakiella magnetica]|nr:hypothetical protein MCP1_80027 [Candidatus Terasakiella magnetica]
MAHGRVTGLARFVLVFEGFHRPGSLVSHGWRDGATLSPRRPLRRSFRSAGNHSGGRDPFAPYKSLAELTASPVLRLGYIDGFSYGSSVDAFIAKMTGMKISRGTTQPGMVSMLAGERFDYMFADQEEYEAVARAANIPPESLRLLVFPDVPEGNKRYLMCNKAVPRNTIDRIDAAIQP